MNAPHHRHKQDALAPGMRALMAVILFGVSTSNLLAQLPAQPLHFDPWSDNQSWSLLLNNDRELIASNHVERMDRYLCHPGKKRPSENRLMSTVTFNASGNPVYCQDRWVIWSSYKQRPEDVGKRLFGKGLVGIVEYRFMYGEKGHLEHVSEVSWDAPYSRHERDVRFTYDAEGRLVQETIEARHIYKPGFKYRGTKYPNDTSVVRFTLSYISGNHVRHLIRSTGPETSDTLYKDVPFHDLFPMWADSYADTDTIEVAVVTGHATLLGGACVPTLSDNVVRRHIHEGGKLRYTETVNRKTGAISGRRTTVYRSDGLYDATIDEKGTCIYRMEYALRR